ncbi:MAG: nucleoside triphosphate pyrophosphohydrolase [Dehalococcoidales bacterium]|nr:nucleoside triphosphate pyrophosphohydrolase [Dehalococcoidales bacterium]
MPLPQSLDRFTTLVEIIALLRSPEGCPWDRKQTHESLRKNLLEEAYEVLEAMDEADMDKLSEEFGDLLLQIVLHSQIAKDNGEFTVDDVIRKINEKLIYRHPHVFGDTKVRDAEEVTVNWEELKKNKRRKEASVLDGVPASMPALAYSQAVQGRVARIGFDWQEDSGVLEKMAEEIDEFKAAGSQQQKEEEFGDILFTLANFARRQGIDLESALRKSNRRFYKRFSAMEEFCRQRGLDFSKLSFDEQNELWEEAKQSLGE